jgi:hypothetical protein
MKIISIIDHENNALRCDVTHAIAKAKVEIADATGILLFQVIDPLQKKVETLRADLRKLQEDVERLMK